MSYKGFVSVSKALGSGERPDVRVVGGDTVFVEFGDDSSQGTGGVRVFGSIDEVAMAFDSALTEVQALIDSRED